MKNQIKENKTEIVNILVGQVKEGIKIAKDLKVNQPEYGVVLTNLLNAYKASEQMGAEIEFDQEQAKLNEEYAKKQQETEE